MSHRLCGMLSGVLAMYMYFNSLWGRVRVVIIPRPSFCWQRSGLTFSLHKFLDY